MNPKVGGDCFQGISEQISEEWAVFHWREVSQRRMMQTWVVQSIQKHFAVDPFCVRLVLEDTTCSKPMHGETWHGLDLETQSWDRIILFGLCVCPWNQKQGPWVLAANVPVCHRSCPPASQEFAPWSVADSGEIMEFVALPRSPSSLQQGAFAPGEGNPSKLPSPHPLFCLVCWWISPVTWLLWAQLEPGAGKLLVFIQLVSWLSVQIWISLLNKLDILANLQGLRRASILTDLETVFPC